MRASRFRISLIAVGLLLLLACMPEPSVRPAPVAGAAENSALVDEAEVRLEVVTDSWRGDPSPLTAVLPIELEIRNTSAAPVEIDPAAVTLHFEDGQVRAAEAVDELEDEELVDETLYGSGTRLIDEYGFPVSQTLPNPSRPLLGQGPEPGDPPLVISDPLREPDTELLRVPLPTHSMLQSALRSTTLAPGASVRGFVYFDELPADAERAELRLQVGDAALNVPLLFEGS